MGKLSIGKSEARQQKRGTWGIRAWGYACGETALREKGARGYGETALHGGGVHAWGTPAAEPPSAETFAPVCGETAFKPPGTEAGPAPGGASAATRPSAGNFAPMAATKRPARGRAPCLAAGHEHGVGGGAHVRGDVDGPDGRGGGEEQHEVAGLRAPDLDDCTVHIRCATTWCAVKCFAQCC